MRNHNGNSNYDGPQRYLLTYEFENEPPLKMVIFDLHDRQEPGERFDPSHRCQGPLLVTTREYDAREGFYQWLDVFLGDAQINE